MMSRIIKNIRRVPIHVILILASLSMILPFLWMVSTSFKQQGSVFVFPPQWIPQPIIYENYTEIFSVVPYARGILNSIKITGLVTAGTLFSSSLAAYAFAKIQFRGKTIFFIIILSTIMIPIQVTIIPMFILFKKIGWIDTHLPLIVPHILCNAFGVFLLRQFLLAIPDELGDAARIDGCGEPRIYFNIMLPNCKPALSALAIFTFMANWNSFLEPLIFLNTRTKYTIPLIVSMCRGLYWMNWPLSMAAATLATVPIIIFFVAAQKYFIEGIVITGLKG